MRQRDDTWICFSSCFDDRRHGDYLVYHHGLGCDYVNENEIWIGGHVNDYENETWLVKVIQSIVTSSINILNHKLLLFLK